VPRRRPEHRRRARRAHLCGRQPAVSPVQRRALPDSQPRALELTVGGVLGPARAVGRARLRARPGLPAVPSDGRRGRQRVPRRAPRPR
jgi:hypothetical protein